MLLIVHEGSIMWLPCVMYFKIFQFILITFNVFVALNIASNKSIAGVMLLYIYILLYLSIKKFCVYLIESLQTCGLSEKTSY